MIKPRAWYKQEYKMCEVLSLDFVKKEADLFYSNNAAWEVVRKTKSFKGIRFDELIFLYSTGLKDNENKELYFYDAVKTYAGKRFLGMSVIKSLSDLVGLINAISESGINFKIIGNVFENPGLQK